MYKQYKYLILLQLTKDKKSIQDYDKTTELVLYLSFL